MEFAFISLGLFYSSIVGHWAIARLMKQIHQALGREPSLRWLPSVVGILERILFTVSWLLDAKGFIAVWIALKAAGEWKWQADLAQKEYPNNATKNPPRWAFNVFLIGTGVSLAFGVTGALMADWLAREDFLLGFLIPVLLVLSSLVLEFWVSRKGQD